MAWYAAREHRCITVTCADCKRPLGDEDTDAHWHFDTEDEACSALSDAEWTVQGPEAVCDRCTSTRLCMSVGTHTWKHHPSWRGESFNGDEPRIYPEWWSCEVCPTTTMTRPANWEPSDA